MKSGRPVAVASQSQPLKAQQSKTQQATSQQPATKRVTSKTVIRHKRASLLWIGIGMLLFIPLAAASLFLPMLLNVPQPTETFKATPTKKPIATAISTESAPLLAVVPTKASECIPWDEITAAAEGKTTCVYGEVTTSKDFPPDGLFSYTLVRFSGNQRDFYLIAHDRTLLLTKAGDCLSTTSIVSVDANGVPFMEPSTIETNKYSCMN
jgi:hypothetical protein